MLNAVRIWIFLSTVLVASGWILSALNQLNRIGYGVVLVLTAGTLILWQRKTKWCPRNFNRRLFRFIRHFRHAAPMLFMVIALMSLVAGALYFPANADSSAYRIPRILEWLGDRKWHWISTLDLRMNIAGCNFEWLATPLILFTHSLRFIFLINWISYLLLPGLIFSVFTRLDVRPRVAWWWMWLLPTGWCYAMQAASDVNDSFAAVYALAAMDFALRAWKGKNISYAWISMLALALLTGTKQTIIPLALVCIAAIIPVLPLLRRRILSTAMVTVVCLLISFAPLAFFNFKHTGAWSGVPPHTSSTAIFWTRCQPDSWFWGIVGNAFCLPAQNLEPPIFPWSDKWNAGMQHFLQTPFGAHFNSFENFGYLRRAITEETAGIGLGIVLLTAVSFFFTHLLSRRDAKNNSVLFLHILQWIPFVALLIFMAKVSSFQNARQLGPYYIFFFPAILTANGHAQLVRRHWWQMLVVFFMAFTALLLVAARNRPLFPAQTIIASLQSRYAQSKNFSKIAESYAFWPSMRAIVINPLKSKIPTGEPIVGYATVVGFSEPGLWMSSIHKVERILPSETASDFRRKSIHYVIIGSEYFEISREKTIEEWTQKFNADLIGSVSYDYGPGSRTCRLFLVRLR